MEDIDLSELAKKHGYSPELIDFLQRKCAFSFGWNHGTLVDAIKKRIPEREILSISFRPWNEGVYSDDECEYWEAECDREGEREYLSHCDKDGRFRYEDFS